MNHSPTSGSISAFFENDHREIDAIYEKIEFRNANDDLAHFENFSRRLDRHIRWEEDILFPAVAQRNPHLEMGPIRVMKIEHEGIRDNKSKAREAFTMANVGSAREYCEQMIGILADHNMKEEQILYPACDQTLTQESIKKILDRVSAEK